jgi:two-component system CheB/CheR fusion protein
MTTDSSPSPSSSAADPSIAVELAASLADAQPVESAAGGQLRFPTVAIGASAGGVEALIQLFKVLPADTGCAFVVIVHLAAQRESVMAELIARATTMPVAQVQASCEPQANHVYVIPPGQYLAMSGGRLQVQAITRWPPKPMVVDRFMISLAADQRERAIGIVLTGTDGDGSLGVKAIKSEGGMTMAQQVSQAAYPSMPSSAVATGFIDREYELEAMPAALLDYIAGAGLAAAPAPPEPADEAALLLEILGVLRAGTGLDFSGYKKPMLQRRIYRRMGLARLKDMHAYVELLRHDAGEADALAGDFLISVTEFFREPSAWHVLATEVLPLIVAAKQPGEPLRVWVPACATGEEAYSVAMLLMENQKVVEWQLKPQVFATDIDRKALDVARLGRYPRTIENMMEPSRLRRFFQRSGDGYQVRKSLRELLTFAPQNLVTDPPFSRMDLVSCRNLLIYMEPELQRRVLKQFHFALLPDAFLALGKSETIGNMGAQFAASSPQGRIYRRIGPGPVAAANPRSTPGTPRESLQSQRAATNQNQVMDYNKIVRQALEDEHVDTALLIDGESQIVYFHGAVHRYLEHPDGMPTQDLFTLLHEALRPQLRAAVHKASTAKQATDVIVSPLDDNNAGEGSVRMRVIPLDAKQAGTQGLLLVGFERLERPPESAQPVSAAEGSALRSLEEQLRNTKRELRTAIEELESANEELKVANEEAMSTNEELQSTNEELETSKEELQSVNEELTTVNQQLQSKLQELEMLNDDLNNLLASTSIPTLFLDRQLHIKRFTPAATRLFSLIPSDLNRPLSDIASHADINQLLDDARQVLLDLQPIEREISSRRGEHYLRRTLPYRTQEDRIDGVVITFTDISELVSATEGLRRFAAVMQGSNDAIIVHDLQGHVLAWNKGAEALYGWREAELLGRDIVDLLPAEARPVYRTELGRVLGGEPHRYVEAPRLHRDGRLIEVSASMSLIADAGGQVGAVALIERDISRLKQTETELRQSEQRFRTLADNAPVLIWMSQPDGRLEFVNREMCEFTGREPQQLINRRLAELLHEDDAGKAAHALTRLGSGETRLVADLRLRARDGSCRWMRTSALLQPDAALAGAGRVIGSMVDIDSQVGAQQALREAARHKDEFLAMLGHELRNPLVPIRNAAEVLNRVAGDDGRLGWVHDVLVRQVGHVTRLVDDLLDISMITRGSLQLRLEPVDLRFTLERAIESVQPLLARKQLRLQRPPSGPPVWVEGDPIRLIQIFSNLLTNAAKYSDEGGPVRLGLAVDERAGEVLVQVSDAGLGIAPEMQGRIFELFVQDGRSIDRSQGGLGIGLALVRHLVGLHGGSVEAHSEGIGRGSTFSVRLRRLAPAQLQVPTQPSSIEDSAGGRVMIVDDDAEGGDSMAVLLRMYGYQVEHAVDVESALQAARSFQPQVVLMDIGLPGTDGYQLALRMRAMPEFPDSAVFIGLSGFGQPEDFRRSEAAGFVAHMIKPADPDELHQMLQRVLTGGVAAD